MESSPLDVRSAFLGFVAGALVALVGALVIVPSDSPSVVVDNAAQPSNGGSVPGSFGTGATAGTVDTGSDFVFTTTGDPLDATTGTGGPVTTGSTSTSTGSIGGSGTPTQATTTSSPSATTGGDETSAETSGSDGTSTQTSGTSGTSTETSSSSSGSSSGSTGSTSTTGDGSTSTTGDGSTSTTGSGSDATSGDATSCQAGENGGATADGVTGDRILLGATVVESGVGAAFLGQADSAIDAVIAKVNRAGGICGRMLDRKFVDDAWDPQAGFEAIKSLVEGEKVFLLAVVPSSEGLNTASEAGYFERKKVPVVGSDGMIRTQYTDPYIFPVAASTVSIMHIMAKDAFDRGATKFGLVYEKTYRFGVEGAFAFNAAVKRLTGSDIRGYEDPFGSPTCPNGTQFCAIGANEQDYSADARNFNAGCLEYNQLSAQYNKCDFVGLLLEPATGLQWFRTADTARAAPGPTEGERGYYLGTGAAQPMFTRDFAIGCEDKCDGLQLWTGYNPPIEQYATSPAVQTYVNDLKSVSSQLDEFNQFTQGAYLGMRVLVEALARTGPNLTRQGVIDTLHTMPPLETGLAPPLSWRPGNHFANPAAQVFEINSQQGFRGWELVHGYVQDPWLGQDVG